MESFSNHITLRGSLVELPSLSHESHGKHFLRFYLEIPRLSGNIDTIPVIAEKSLVDCLDPAAGQMITVHGQIRTHNIRSDGKKHLVIYVFAQSVIVEDGTPVNDVSLDGVICRDPVYRRTPLGREICDIMLAVPRIVNRSDYIPCILWGKNAKALSSSKAGDHLQVNGRLQSRVYTKITEESTEERTAYEVSSLFAEITVS